MMSPMSKINDRLWCAGGEDVFLLHVFGFCVLNYDIGSLGVRIT